MIDRLNTIARRVPTWVVYIVGLLPIPWLLFQAQTGGLGAEPIKALEKELGLLALQLLIAGLAITPARRTLRARYQLVDESTGAQILDDTAGSDAGIDVTSSEYATIAAEDTALERLSQTVADQIITRLALYSRKAANP